MDSEHVEARPDETSAAGAAPLFSDLGLSEATLAAVAQAGYLNPTPIQAGLIPRALAGVDVLGQARTGTGKTASFVLPIMEKLNGHGKPGMPLALVLVPTRELAVQVRGEVDKLSHGRRIHCVPVYGGKPIRGQMEKLKRGVDVVVGTPGRVLDMMGRGALSFENLQIAVLDEADRMLDIGFRPDIEKILRKCPKDRQTLLLSATVPPPIKRLAERYMQSPEMLDFSSQDMSVETIDQFYFTVDPERKFGLLEKLLEREKPRQAIVFCRTKRGTDKVQRRLSKHLKSVDCIHGDMQQSSRDRVMQAFRDGKVQVLVATDVVGRGIDVSNISHIINYDLPQFCDDYVHRVGRTGRMGREGVAFSFVTPEEGNELTRIEIRINRLLKRDEIPGYDALTPLASPAALPASGLPAAPGAASEGNGETATPTPEKPKVPPPPGKRGKRYRRAL